LRYWMPDQVRHDGQKLTIFSNGDPIPSGKVPRFLDFANPAIAGLNWKLHSAHHRVYGRALVQYQDI
jgi:hypothetical protein